MRLASGLPRVHADRVQLQQVILNLVMDSLEAMRETDGPRELTISASSSYNAHHVLIAVLDTGPGFDSEGLAHQFELLCPFDADCPS